MGLQTYESLEGPLRNWTDAYVQKFCIVPMIQKQIVVSSKFLLIEPIYLDVQTSV